MTSREVPGALRRLATGSGLTIGLELPLEADWNAEGNRRRMADGRPFGVPSMEGHEVVARQADRAGFTALWLRDVPLYDPGFGDAGQVFDAFSYLGYLAGITEDILLGTAAIVLPLRHPFHTAKAAATVDRLSGGRLVLGLATGDRPVEFPLFGADFEGRGEAFRKYVATLRAAWADGTPPDPTTGGPLPGIEVLPKPVCGRVPLVMAGRGRQTPEWIAENMDGRFDYPRGLVSTAHQIAEWRDLTGASGDERKPFISAFRLDLDDDPDASPRPTHKFGARMGRNAFLRYLEALERADLDHLAVHLRHSRRPAREIIEELAEHVLPAFPTPRPAPTPVRTAG